MSRKKRPWRPICPPGWTLSRAEWLPLVLLLAAGGCATIYNPATQRQETLLSTSVELALGQLARTQMGLGELTKGRVTPEEFQRVQRIGQQIARVSDRQDLRYQFGVIRHKTPNAFTLPGGTIYVHTGILDMADDDELAAVIAHEVGHVAARHIVKHLQADLGFAVAMQIAGSAGATGEAVRVANSLYTLFSRGYSRRDELEADRLSIRYTRRAGFDPWAIIRFFEKMLAQERQTRADRAAVWQSSHPMTSERIAKARQILESEGPSKFCPECGRSYPAQAEFCVRDGIALKTAVSPGGSR